MLIPSLEAGLRLALTSRVDVEKLFDVVQGAKHHQCVCGFNGGVGLGNPEDVFADAGCTVLTGLLEFPTDCDQPEFISLRQFEVAIDGPAARGAFNSAIS